MRGIKKTAKTALLTAMLFMISGCTAVSEDIPAMKQIDGSGIMTEVTDISPADTKPADTEMQTAISASETAADTTADTTAEDTEPVSETEAAAEANDDPEDAESVTESENLIGIDDGVSPVTAPVRKPSSGAVLPETTITFTALGDNLIHSAIYNQAAKRSSAEGRYDFAYAYAGVADLLDRADLTVLNQETLICNDVYEPSTYPCFNSPTDLGDYMVKLGVDVFTIANNHTLDKGTKGLEACLDYYDERGLVRVGAYRNAEDRANIRTVTVKGVTVSFLCYTEFLNGLSLPEGSPLQIGRLEIDRIKEEIGEAKKISDLCVVALHWGVENSGTVTNYQREFAKDIAEAGADIIIGNHPHVLRDVEIFDNSDGGQTICAYSLGNFISAQSEGTNLIGGILDFSVSVGGGHEPRITDTEFIPIVTHYDGNYSNIRLYKLSDYTPDMAASHGVRSMSHFDYDYINEYIESKGLDKYIK